MRAGNEVTAGNGIPTRAYARYMSYLPLPVTRYLPLPVTRYLPLPTHTHTQPAPSGQRGHPTMSDTEPIVTPDERAIDHRAQALTANHVDWAMLHALLAIEARLEELSIEVGTAGTTVWNAITGG